MKPCLLVPHLMCRSDPKVLPICHISVIPREILTTYTFGTELGSPAAVMVANLVMEDVEDMDDTCVALAANKCEAFLGHLNLVEPTIQLTLEQEWDGKLPFLDVYTSGASPGWDNFHLSV